MPPIKNELDRFTEGNDPKVWCQCEHNGDDIYVGEEVYEVEGGLVREENFEEYAIEQLSARKVYAGEE